MFRQLILCIVLFDTQKENLSHNCRYRLVRQPARETEKFSLRTRTAVTVSVRSGFTKFYRAPRLAFSYIIFDDVAKILLRSDTVTE